MLYAFRLYFTTLLFLLLTGLLGKLQFAIYHYDEFAHLGSRTIAASLLWGLRFDIAIAAAFALLAWLAAHLVWRLLRIELLLALRIFGFLFAVALLFIHASDTLYYAEASRHMGYELLEGLNSASEVLGHGLTAAPLFFTLQWLLLLPLYALHHRLFRKLAPLPKRGGWRRLTPELALLLLLPFSVILIRGGITNLPQEPLIAQEIGNTEQAALALSGAYNAVYNSISAKAIRPVLHEVPTAQDWQHIATLYPQNAGPNENGSTQAYNVMYILLESWTSAYMAPYGYHRITTPNFDALQANGLSSTAMVADGRRTTEGMFTSLCSWQNPLGQTVAQSQLQEYNYRCLPHILREHGYRTAFYQGSHTNTSGTGAFGRLLGYEKSQGKADVADYQYPHNYWGLHDHDLYRFVLSELDTMQQPFFIGINTNTTHDRVLPPGIEPRFGADTVQDMYDSVKHFSDDALRVLLEGMRARGLDRNTILVMFGDHTKSAPADSVQRHLVPFAIHAPHLFEGRQINSAASMRDIAPTLLDILGIETPAHMTGRSLLGEPSLHFADYYNQGMIGWLEGLRGIEFVAGKEQLRRCYDLALHPQRSENTECNEADLLMRERAMAFARINQHLLFKGETQRFNRQQWLTKPQTVATPSP